MQDRGKRERLRILHQKATLKIINKLQTHQWHAEILETVDDGEYVVIKASRGEQSHKIALIYSAATANAIYRRLNLQVEHIFTNGQLNNIESYAYGINVPVDPVDNFHNLMLQWNENNVDGKFASLSAGEEPTFNRQDYKVIRSENPIKQIWSRLRQIRSVTLARKLIEERLLNQGVSLEESAAKSKADGLAYAVRNAIDYYQIKDDQSVSQRVLNLYYGSLSFAFADMLAIPEGPNNLSELEDYTKQGHGLYTLDGENKAFNSFTIGRIQNGFFSKWMDILKLEDPNVPQQKPKYISDLSKISDSTYTTMEQLFGQFPELGDLYLDIFAGPPRWVFPIYDFKANGSPKRDGVDSQKTYIQLVDESCRLQREFIANLPGPIGEISEIKSDQPGRHFRVAVNHKELDYWHEALKIHSSPFVTSTLIMPLFGSVSEFRAVAFVLLYALSIIVRYRPSIWRRIQEGDLDEHKALIEAFLDVVERVLPEQFLASISGRKIYSRQPGSLLS